MANKYYHPNPNSSPLFEKDNLGDIINDYRKSLKLGQRNFFEKGPFRFEYNDHDTGFSVIVYIDIPNLPRRMIINCVYW
jgi:hypothetical protein